MCTFNCINFVSILYKTEVNYVAAMYVLTSSSINSSSIEIDR